MVVTAYEEGEHIITCLNRLREAVTLPCEIMVVVDDANDSTAPFVRDYAAQHPEVVLQESLPFLGTMALWLPSSLPIAQHLT